MIAGYVTGASRGIIYVRAEYPLAVLRLERAVEQARAYGLLGANVMGRGFDFDIETVEGAGAFVCGEETALIASLEDQAGRPRPRPPFPAQRGLYGKPTNINNVETWYNVAADRDARRGLVHRDRHGQERRHQGLLAGRQGSQHGPGGDAARHAAGEDRLRHRRGRDRTAARSRPCRRAVPRAAASRPTCSTRRWTTRPWPRLGSIMGSGGMVVMDEDNCMVDVARYFVEFTHSESCGKCVPCRVGLDKALQMLNGFTVGEATPRISPRWTSCAAWSATPLCAAWARARPTPS